MANIGTNVVFDAISPYLVDRIMELDAPEERGIDEFDYVQSDYVAEPHELLRNLHTYQSDKTSAHPNLGPIENEILHFANDRKIRSLVLVGNLGSGKTTCVRFLVNRYIRPSGALACIIDFRPVIESLVDSDSDKNPSATTGAVVGSEVYDQEAVEEIGQFLTNDDCLPFEEEIRAMWSWAFKVDRDSPARPAARVLQRIKELLRPMAPPGEDETSESSAMIAHRRHLHAKFIAQADFRTLLRYHMLRVNYLVHKRFGGDPTRILLVFDNMDNAPWDFHTRLFSKAQSLAQIGFCNVLIVLRPLTYAAASSSGNAGTGHTVFYHVEHNGPELQALMHKRITERLLGLSHEQLADVLSAHFKESNKTGEPRKVVTTRFGSYAIEFNGYQVPFSCIYRWIEAVKESLDLNGRNRDSGLHGISQVITRVAGNSLRSAKLLITKVFQTNAIRIEGVLGIPHSAISVPGHAGSRGRRLTVLPEANSERWNDIRPSEAMRAMLRWNKAQFVPQPDRIIDNVFHTACGSQNGLLCKLRILQALKTKRSEHITVADIWQWATLFGYREQTVRFALNDMLHQKKRMVWSDTLDQIPPLLPTHGTSRLVIAPAGEAYIDYLIHEFHYVEEMAPSANWWGPKELGHDLIERSERVRRFVRHVLDRDVQEIEGVVFDGKLISYEGIYGATLMSVQMIRHVAEGAVNLLRAQEQRAQNEGSHTLISQVQQELAEWKNFLVEKADQQERWLRQELVSSGLAQERNS